MRIPVDVVRTELRKFGDSTAKAEDNTAKI